MAEDSSTDVTEEDGTTTSASSAAAFVDSSQEVNNLDQIKLSNKKYNLSQVNGCQGLDGELLSLSLTLSVKNEYESPTLED